MSKHPALLICAFLLAACSSTGATRQSSNSPPATQPASGGLLSETSSINEILDALEAAGKDLVSLRARILLTDLDNETGAETPRPGEFLLQRDGEQVLFRARLDGVLVKTNGQTGLREDRVEYLLKDNVLIDRNYKKRTEVRRKLPPHEGQRDLLKLGEGPFPLPIGQNRDEVLAQFSVIAVDPTDPSQNDLGIEAPSNTRRLRLTPVEGTSLAGEFRWLEIDVNLSDGMPAQVITLSNTGSSARVTRLQSIERNATIPATAFDLEPIDPNQWNVMVEEME
jgi:hypothetical protein